MEGVWLCAKSCGIGGSRNVEVDALGCEGFCPLSLLLFLSQTKKEAGSLKRARKPSLILYNQKINPNISASALAAAQQHDDDDASNPILSSNHGATSEQQQKTQGWALEPTLREI